MEMPSSPPQSQLRCGRARRFDWHPCHTPTAPLAFPITQHNTDPGHPLRL